MGFLSAVLKIAEKDIRVELRRVYEIISILTFSASSVIVSSFAWGGATTVSSEAISATLWVILFFTSILAFTTSFTREMDRGTIGGLKTLPCPPSAILLGKTLYSIALLSVAVSTLIPLSIIFLNLTISGAFAGLPVVFLLGIIDLSIAGSFVSGLVMFSQGKNVLLSFLLFPVAMPVLISSVLATEKIIRGLTLLDAIEELRLLIAFLIILGVVTSFTFKYILEE